MEVYPGYRAAILITGSEVLDGRVLDSNSNYLAQQCQKFGLSLRRIVTCDDRIDEIKQCLKFAADGVELLIVSGGLGPTSDDVTRDAIAEFVGQPLVENAQVLDQLKERYRKRARSFDPSNVRQALFPEKAVILSNPVGTAAGFAVTLPTAKEGKLASKSRMLVSLPGVPRELYAMWPEVVLPLLREQLSAFSPVPCMGFHTFGLPESTVGSRVQQCALPAEIIVAYRAAFPEVHVSLRSSTLGTLVLQDWAQKVVSGIGSDYVISRELGKGLETVLSELLLAQHTSLAVAESCSAGLLAATLTEMAGASNFMLGGTIAYANQVKIDALGVAAETLDRCGAVSAEVAREMAQGARSRHRADYGISITGIAGPEGGTLLKPVGLFYVGLASADETLAIQYFFPNSRGYVRRYAVHCAMDLLRRHLLGLPLPASAELPEGNTVADTK